VCESVSDIAPLSTRFLYQREKREVERQKYFW